jgi:hypothetical protein
MGLFERARERRCAECGADGQIVVEASATYRRTVHCYVCDGTGRVRVMPNGDTEPLWGWARRESQPPPERQPLPGTAIPDS